MESINSKLIKESFKSFSKDNKYEYYESDPLEAPADSRLLFNISGGVKYQNELLGLNQSEENRVSSIQRCIRTDGMKSIGYSGRHHLFFEMIGHFMFYCACEKECKEEFIKFAYDYLTKSVGLDKSRIYATVHPSDQVSLDIWKKIIDNNIILNADNTFVSPYADKSSLRTEIKWSKEDGTLVELWNLVFTQFNSKQLFENPSELIAADSGASLERIVSAYENKNNNYENSMWCEFVKFLSQFDSSNEIETYRRLADFFNTSIMLIDEGIKPGNKVQPYVLRKMLRTIFDMCNDLNIGIKIVFEEYLKYVSLSTDKKEIYQIIKEELERYYLAIESGIVYAQKLIRKKGINDVDFEMLKSSCGLSDKYIDLLRSDKPITLKKVL